MHEMIDIAIERVPVLPDSMKGLFDVLNDPMAGFDDLSAIVNQDPTLATQTLHLCNSVYYSFPVEVTSVSHAVRLIGMKTVSGLAMAAYFQGLLEPKGVSGSVWLRGAKNHVLATAWLAEFLVREMSVKESPGTAFTGGLLHDIGKLVLSRMPSTIATKVRNHMDEAGLSLLDAERIVLGTDHPEVGYRLAECWKVPDVIADVIRYHHMPIQSQYLLTPIIHAANTLAHQLEAEAPGVIEVSHIDPNVLYELHLTEDDVLTLVNNWITRSSRQYQQTTPLEMRGGPK